MDEHREQWLGGYRLLRRLGAGGAGTVWLAEDGAGERVALKLLHPALASTEEARRRLAREATTVNQVRCTGVARVLDVEVDDSQPFVVTEFVEGPTLALRLRSGALAPREVAALASSLSHTLTAVHGARIVHRDVKPSNVILNPMGPVLIDFGIAMVQDDDRLTRTGLVSGTAGFTAPELLRGGPASAGTDWWSWAATLLEAATGRPPFGAGNSQAVMLRVLEGRPDTGGLPVAVARQLCAALAVDPSCRPDPGAVVEHLSRPSAWTGPVLGPDAPAQAGAAAGEGAAGRVAEGSGGEAHVSRTELLGPLGAAGVGAGPGVAGSLGTGGVAGAAVTPDGGLRGTGRDTAGPDAPGPDAPGRGEDAGGSHRGSDHDLDRRRPGGDAGGGGDDGATAQLPSAATEVLGGDEGGAPTTSLSQSPHASGHSSEWVAPTAQMPLDQGTGATAPPSSTWNGTGGTQVLPAAQPGADRGVEPRRSAPLSGSVPPPGGWPRTSPAGWVPGTPVEPSGWTPGAQEPPATGGPGAEWPAPGRDPGGQDPSPYWYPVAPYVRRQPLPVHVVGPLLMSGLAALPVVLGAPGSVVVAVVLLLLTTVGVTHAQRELRRVRHQGVRSSDTALALAGLPLHLVRSLLALVAGLLAGGLVAGGAWVGLRGGLGGDPPDLAWPLRVLAAPGINNWQSEGSPSALLLPLWGMVVLVLLVLWVLPTSRRLREGTALVVRTLLPPRWSRAVLGALVVVVLTATWYILTGGVI